MSRQNPSHPVDREAVQDELRELARQHDAETAEAAAPSGGEPCPKCMLRLVCRAQGLACADRVAFMRDRPQSGSRRPRAKLGEQVRTLLAKVPK